jgi:putative transposase
MKARGETPGISKGAHIMPHALCSAALHMVFSTKDRRCVFRTQEMRADTSAYITGILKNLDCPVIRIGMAVEHVHVLYQHSRTATIADAIAAAKRGSSEWIKSQPWARLNADFAQFHWQGGYGVFSVSESRIEAASAYIDGQMEHHKRVTFQDEYRDFLKRHKMTFDERYVWD